MQYCVQMLHCAYAQLHAIFRAPCVRPVAWNVAPCVPPNYMQYCVQCCTVRPPNYIEKFIAWRVNSTLNFTRKTDKRFVRYRFFKWNLTWNSQVRQWIFLESHKSKKNNEMTSSHASARQKPFQSHRQLYDFLRLLLIPTQFSASPFCFCQPVSVLRNVSGLFSRSKKPNFSSKLGSLSDIRAEYKNYIL